MPTHHEPRNGDYAAYVEQLSNRGANAPGQIIKPASGRKKRRLDPDPFDGQTSGSMGPGSVDSILQRPASPSSASPYAAAPLPAGPGKDAPDTLASASKRRFAGLGIYVIVAVLFIQAFTMLIDAIEYGREDIDDYLPSLFLAAFAYVMLKAGRAARRQGRQAPKPLPPLSTISSKPGSRGPSA